MLKESNKQLSGNKMSEYYDDHEDNEYPQNLKYLENHENHKDLSHRKKNSIISDDFRFEPGKICEKLSLFWLINDLENSREGETKEREKILELANEKLSVEEIDKILLDKLRNMDFDFAEFVMTVSRIERGLLLNICKKFIRIMLELMGREFLQYFPVDRFASINSDDFNFIFDYDLNFNIVDQHGNTPLHIAIKCNNENFIKRLLRKDLDLSIRNLEEKTCFDLVIEQKAEDIGLLLVDKIQDPEKYVHSCIEKCMDKLAVKLLERM